MLRNVILTLCVGFALNASSATRLATYGELQSVSNNVVAVETSWNGSVAKAITANDTNNWNGKPSASTVTGIVNAAIASIPPATTVDIVVNEQRGNTTSNITFQITADGIGAMTGDAVQSLIDNITAASLGVLTAEETTNLVESVVAGVEAPAGDRLVNAQTNLFVTFDAQNLIMYGISSVTVNDSVHLVFADIEAVDSSRWDSFNPATLDLDLYEGAFYESLVGWTVEGTVPAGQLSWIDGTVWYGDVPGTWTSGNGGQGTITATLNSTTTVTTNALKTFASFEDMTGFVATAQQLLTKLDRSDGTTTNLTLAGTTTFTPSTATLSAGQISYDETTRCWNFGLGVAPGSIGEAVTWNGAEEALTHIHNNSGADIFNGAVVAYAGGIGASPGVRARLFPADSGPEAILGIATEDIENGLEGKVTHRGYVRGINASGSLFGETGWTNGQALYCNPATNGYLTGWKPQAPRRAIFMGIVANNHNVNGMIYVKPHGGQKFVDLDDVDGTPLTTSGQLAVWDQTRQVFDFTDNISTRATFADVTNIVNSANFALKSDVPPTNNPAFTGTATLNGSALVTTQQLAAVCSQQCIRAWMPLTTHNWTGYADLPAASNSIVQIGPAPLQSFILRPLISNAVHPTMYTYSNIVFYSDSASGNPLVAQGFDAVTTGVFQVSAWGLTNGPAFLIRRNDTGMSFGASRRNIQAYSLGMASSVRFFSMWSPATPAELNAGSNVFWYGNDAY